MDEVLDDRRGVRGHRGGPALGPHRRGGPASRRTRSRPSTAATTGWTWPAAASTSSTATWLLGGSALLQVGPLDQAHGSPPWSRRTTSSSVVAVRGYERGCAAADRPDARRRGLRVRVAAWPAAACGCRRTTASTRTCRSGRPPRPAASWGARTPSSSTTTWSPRNSMGPPGHSSTSARGSAAVITPLPPTPRASGGLCGPRGRGRPRHRTTRRARARAPRAPAPRTRRAGRPARARRPPRRARCSSRPAPSGKPSRSSPCAIRRDGSELVASNAARWPTAAPRSRRWRPNIDTALFCSSTSSGASST